MAGSMSAEGSDKQGVKGSEIGIVGGVPTLVVDGRPMGAMMFQWSLGRKARPEEELAVIRRQLRALGEMDIEMYFARLTVSDPDQVEIPLAELDRQAAFLLDVLPDARIVPWVTIGPYAGFAEKHPGDVITFDDGRTGPYTWPKFMGLESPDTPRYTYASLAWQEEVSGMLRRLVRHVDRAAYRDHLAGYFFFPHCCETSYFWDYDYLNRCIDYSPAMLRCFRSWLRQRYQGDAQALRAAWGDPAVTFETAQLPSRHAKSTPDFGGFWDPGKSRGVIDYFTCHAQALADRITHFARVVKQESSRKVAVGFFYGYLQNQDYLYGGQSVFKGVLNDDAIDFWAGPFSYENRGPGDHPCMRFLLKTLRNHGKLWLAECDTLMHDTTVGTLRHHGYPDTTLEQTLEVMKRDFAQILCEAANGWWVDWACGPSFYEGPCAALLKRMQAVSRASLGLPRDSATDIAAVVDQESILVTPHRLGNPAAPGDRGDETPELAFLTLDRLKIHELPRIGSPCDFIEMDDALADGAADYRMLVFLNPFSIDGRERERIERKLKCDGRTLVWLYAPGLIDPDASTPLALEHMEALTGMRMGCAGRSRRVRMRVDCHDDPITAHLPRGMELGDFDRPVTSGFAMDKKTMAPMRLAGLRMNPLFYVDDPRAAVLARYVEGGEPAMAVRRFENWTSVYVGSPGVSAAVLRGIAAACGAHLYGGADEIVYANQSFLAIHSAAAGRKTLNLRGRSDVYDVFVARQLARGVERIELDMPAQATRLLFLGDGAEFERLAAEPALAR